MFIGNYETNQFSSRKTRSDKGKKRTQYKKRIAQGAALVGAGALTV